MWFIMLASMPLYHHAGKGPTTARNVRKLLDAFHQRYLGHGAADEFLPHEGRDGAAVVVVGAGAIYSAAGGPAARPDVVDVGAVFEHFHVGSVRIPARRGSRAQRRIVRAIECNARIRIGLQVDRSCKIRLIREQRGSVGAGRR